MHIMEIGVEYLFSSKELIYSIKPSLVQKFSSIEISEEVRPDSIHLSSYILCSENLIFSSSHQHYFGHTVG